ncbi:MAG: M16 family metallopeptidase, partial [Gemmatimonadales bacterium]
DITRYFETLPSNRLNLGLWLEADRMRSLAVTDSNLRNQREVVKEERRLSYDNQPYAGAFVDGLAAGYDSATCFAYAHPTIGSMDDLNAAHLEDVQAFFRLYYTPNNARLVVSGDFDGVQAKRLIADYFGDIPRGATPPPVICAGPYHAGARRRAVNDRLANLPAAVNFYRIPDHAHDDTPALELISTILGQGESSRLNVRLARAVRAAVSTQAAIFASRRGPSLFGAFAVANQGVSADSLAGLLAAEVARIAEEGVTQAELDKAKNVYRALVVSNRQRAFDVAEELHHAATFHGSAEAVNGDFARYMAVTVEGIRRVAQAYLTSDNVLVLVVNAGAAP